VNVKQYIDQLRHVSLFSKLDDKDLEIISRITHVKNVNKGQLIFQEGEVGDSLYTMLKGRVKICLYDESGKEYILDIIESGAFFGELSLIDELPRSANVITLDNCEFLIINRRDFVRVLMENPATTISILKTCCNRLRAADERIKGLAFYTVEGRILKYLRDLGAHAGVNVKNYIIIEKGPTQAEIASSCGCSRETVSRTIKSLVKKDIISMVRRQYTLNPGHLEY
jgi:CRP/FNR family transcriptional regulator, cyclic AMP receptor protein